MDVEVSVAELVASARARDRTLPFPFADLATAKGTPSAAVDGQLSQSVVEAVTTPQHTVYAVLAGRDGAVVTRIAAVEGGTDHQCYRVIGSGGRIRISSLGAGDMVQAVVEAVAAAGVLSVDPLFRREVVVPLHVALTADPNAAAESMRFAGVGEAEVAAWLAAGRPRGSGLLGAVSVDGSAGHHVPRSVTWRTYAGGSVLAVELPNRSRRETQVSLQALDRRSLTRAAIDLLTSLHTQGAADSGRFAAAPTT